MGPFGHLPQGSDAVFKALGDPTRRQLLGMLRAKDGQALTQGLAFAA